MIDEEIRNYAGYVIYCLKEEGFVIQRYYSITTSSVYIKLDYGVCNSIRIGDHPGKRLYQYRYNLMKHTVKDVHNLKSPQGWDRWYYGFDRVNNLISRIVRDRDDKLKKFGTIRYQAFMERNRKINDGQKGFWKECEEV